MSRILLILLLPLLLPAKADEQATKRAEMRLYMRGDFIFQKNCAPCHGKTGRGDGTMGREAEPLPRNFRNGVFKYRSTPMGFLPTDADLERTIRRGITGTAMPSFPDFNESEINALLAYIKGFSTRWKDPELVTEPLTIPPTPEWLEDEKAAQPHLAAGKETFATHCISCHGENGKGDGPLAKDLQDAWDKPLNPANLAAPNLRSGPESEDIFRTIATGIDGTPMIGHLEILGTDRIWELIAFIRSLAQEPPE